MDKQLEHTRDMWENAFFTGNYQNLVEYEDSGFKIIYEKEGITESGLSRYEKIAHAVNNSVWKPQKYDLHSEEFSFNRDLTECVVTLVLVDQAGMIQELWQYKEHWKIVELRFIK